MFKIILVFQALTAGWHGQSVSHDYSSWAECEAVRAGMSEGVRLMLERRHFQPFEVLSQCVKDDDYI
jgi:hypothetical protein